MVQKISAAPARGRTPSNARGPSQGTKASSRTPSATLKMPQARRTSTARRGRRYSHDLTRSLSRTDREERELSFYAYIGMPPVSYGVRPLRSPKSQSSPYTNRASTVRQPEPEEGLARSPGARR